MGLIGCISSSLLKFALLTFAISAATLLSFRHITNLTSAICFGFGGSTRPFAEVQAAYRVAYVFELSTLVHEEQTAYQHIQVYSHPVMGSLLVIDGSLQITRADEFYYHEMMVHVPMAYVNARRVVIIGGGDGGALVRVLPYKSVQNVYLVDIDLYAMRRVVQEYFPELHAGYMDHRTKSYAYDGAKWVAEHVEHPDFMGKIDVILVDSTDYGSAETLFTDDFYRDLIHLLQPNGVVVINVDSPAWNADIVAAVQRQLAKLFKYAFVYHTHQPSFLSGHYAFLFLSQNVHPMEAAVDWAAWRGRHIHTYYYTPNVHYAAFALPAALERDVTAAASLRDVTAFDGTKTNAAEWPTVRLAPQRLHGYAVEVQDENVKLQDAADNEEL